MWKGEPLDATTDEIERRISAGTADNALFEDIGRRGAHAVDDILARGTTAD